jgi:PAS domain S-box-containing protein
MQPAEARGSPHRVQLYDGDAFLVESMVRFVGGGLGAGQAGVAIATAPHLFALEAGLRANGLDVEGLRAAGRYLGLEAAQTLKSLLRGGRPDPALFAAAIERPIRALLERHGAPVRAFGEIVSLLWADGRHEAVLQLEELWNELSDKLGVEVLCAYPAGAFGDAAESSAFLEICGRHSHVGPSESYVALASPEERLRAIADLQQKASALEPEIEKNRRASESLSRLAAIVESSEDAIVGKTLDGIVTSWNSAAERMFGYRAEEMIGKPILATIPPERRSDFPTILEAIRRGERVAHFETERVRKDGRRIHVSLTVSPIRDESGRVIGASKIARDVTERKRLEAEREQLLGIAQRACAEAEAASRSKDEFLATLSHELRNPLSAVRNAVSAARLGGRSSEHALEIAARQTEQLSRLIDDLLDVSRITHGRVRLNRRRVPLRGILERAAASTKFLLHDHEHRLALSLPPESLFVDGDPVRLEQIVVNLIGNAVKHSAESGSIQVSGERRGSEAVIRVRDDGAGIAPELLPHVFDLFVQGRPEGQRLKGGLGIGLTIVRSLVALHGGRVEARSEGLGKGAEFVVVLPGASQEAAQAVSSDPTPARAAGGDATRVLVVEDNTDAAESMMMLLEVFGHVVRVAPDGESALEMARSEAPDLMLVDVGLPGIDGYEVARRAREMPELREIVLIALTGFGREEDREHARAAGFDHHLLKPVDPEALRRMVARIAEGSRRSA